jgi:hypothetical protein
MDPRLEIVIPSRHRTQLIRRAVAFHRDPIVCVDEEEVKDYKAVLPHTRLLAHPSEVNTLQRIRQWILDHVEADIIFQMDDDIKRVECMVGHQTRKLTDPADIEAIIWNAALNCQQAGTIFFFFAQVSNPITFQSWKPFKFVTPPVGCAMGFWREAFNRHIRFDPTIQHAGIDATMRILHRYRIVWCDMRFCFVPGPHMVSPGGLAGIRTADGIEIDDERLRRRYGQAIGIDHQTRRKGARGVMSQHISINVVR